VSSGNAGTSSRERTAVSHPPGQGEGSAGTGVVTNEGAGTVTREQTAVSGAAGAKKGGKKATKSEWLDAFSFNPNTEYDKLPRRTTPCSQPDTCST
jgi:hypothetical protein